MEDKEKTHHQKYVDYHPLGYHRERRQRLKEAKALKLASIDIMTTINKNKEKNKKYRSPAPTNMWYVIYPSKEKR